MMEDLNKEFLIKNGGKLWEKNCISRVYFTDTTLEALGFEIVKSLSGSGQKIHSIGKSKIWFDCNSSTLHSDKGMLRAQLNTWGFNCEK